MGTRGSALALAQSGWVARQLKERHKGLEVETVVIKTSGDRFPTLPPREARVLAQTTKGLFIKELEEALLSGSVDFAVHSSKDLPASLAAGLRVAAYPEREDPCDAFIGRAGLTWSALAAGARVGTSSLRRKVQLLAAKPGLEIAPMRGNVDTRLRKLREGACDALVLAYAGLKRLGRSDIEHELIPAEVVVPCPGQGALAVECRSDRPQLASLFAALDCARTRLEVEFERSFLAAAGGGCSTPLGALARAEGGGVRWSAFWSDPEGRFPLRLSGFCLNPAERDAFTASLAAQIKRG